MSIGRVAAILTLAALLISGGLLHAQLRITGTISGSVTDSSGAAVPAAKVVLRDEATNITKEVQSNEAGLFTFPDLSNGSYELTVTVAGFQTAVVKNIRVGTSQTTDVPIRLDVGQQNQTITVEGAAPVLETVSQLVTTTQTTKTVQELPVLNRSNALALARLAPGASPPGGGSTRYNNLPGGAVNVTVDGINNASNGWKSGGTVFYATVPVRLGAVEEIAVETGGLGADSGAQSGANIKFVTRRGGQDYHGSIFYEARSEQFNANTWARNANPATGFRPYSRQHDYGGNVSGRLIPFGYLKDKLFFFANFERVYSPRSENQQFSIMTPLAAQGIYTYLVNGTTDQLRTVNVLQLAGAQGGPTAIDPVAKSIIDLNLRIPQFAARVPDSDFNRDTYVFPSENNLYQYYPSTRFDYHINQKHMFTFAWNYYHSWQAGARRLPFEDVNRTNPFRLGYFIYNGAVQSTFTPTVLNEFRYGVQHSGDSNRYAPNGLYYEYNKVPLRIGGDYLFAGRVPFIDQNNTTGRHYITTIYDTLTWNKGNHTITMGASFRATDWKDTTEILPIPTYSLGTPSGDPLPGLAFTTATMPGIINTDTGNGSGATALYNALIGRVAQANFSRVVDPDTLRYDGFINWTWTRSYMGGTYIQDRWRITPELTLNYGLRWEVQGPMHDVKGLTAAPDFASILGPSVGRFSPGVLSGNNNPTAQIGSTPYRTDYLNFAPNFGFSWNPRHKDGWLGKMFSGKTVLRGSYGIVFYDEGTQMFAANLGGNAGKTVSANLVAGQSSLPRFTTLSNIVANPVQPSAFNFTNLEYKTTINQADQTFRTGLNGMNPDLRAPYTINWRFGVQREIAKNTVVEVSYVGNQAHRPWRTINFNEVNIFENGFLTEFNNAKRNLDINRAAGVTSFENRGLPGQVALPIFEAAFGARGSVAALPAGSGFSSAGFITNLDNGGAGALANSLATGRDYVCRMFGNKLQACPGFVNAGFNAPGPYPINFFLVNPYVAGRINYVDDTGWNSYNGLQVQFRKQYSQGLTWTANYTFSKSLTNLARDTATQDLDYRTNRDQAQDRFLSPFDIRQVVQMFGTYDMPFGVGRKWQFRNAILDGVLGGWTIGSIFVFNTGQPVQITGGEFNNVNVTTNSAANGVLLAPGVTLDQIQSMFNAPRVRLNRPGITDLQRLGVDPQLVGPDGRANPAYLRVNNIPGYFGQLLYLTGRNNWNLDASLTKTFKIREKMNFQLFAAASNVFNHPQWGMPNTNIFSTSFGIVGAPSGSRSMNFRGTINF